MAQPTSTATPATWAGTSGPILYKFTSTNYTNAGYRMEVEIWDNVLAVKIADAKYYANASGALTIDISAFLRSNMSLDNNADLTSGTVYSDINFINYYIKTQEVWIASSESQQIFSDKWAMYGGLQIGVVNDFTGYVDSIKNFLMLQSEGTTIINYPFLISFHALKNSYLRIERFLLGATLDVTDTLISFDGIGFGKHIETGTADELEISIIAGGGSIVALSAFTNQGSGSNWTLGATPTITQSGLFSFTKSLSGAYPMPKGVQVTVSYDFDVTDTTSTTVSGVIYLLNSAFSIVGTSSDLGVLSTGNYTGTKDITPSEAASYVAIKFGIDDGGGNVKYDINAIGISSSVSILSEVKTINVLEDCQNIVMLSWRNSLGGWECYPFTYTQEYTWDYGGGKKAKRLTLFANNLTLNQWEAIQGLNTLGDMYRVNITEMTTSLNRTSATIGQSVYVLNSDGTKVGVNVIGQSNTTNTKQKRHSAIVTIEYPELFLQ